jgi:Tetratricopeptide repeat
LFTVAFRVLLGAVLVSLPAIKLSLESESKDRQAQGWTHFYLIDPTTLTLRADGKLVEGPTQNLTVGQSLLEGLLVTDAASAQRWSNLGAVLARTGQIAKAKYCYSRAAQLAPNSIETLLSVANFYINTRQVRSALPYFGRILSTTNGYDSTVFNDFKTLKLDFDEIVAHGGMPAQMRPAEAYFYYLLGLDDVKNLQKAWAWMRPLSPEDQLAGAYLSFLLRHSLTEEAAKAWVSQVREREPGYGKTTFLLNGDFEREPNGTILDWRIMPDPHVRVKRDASAARSGQWSLRIEFDGKDNVNFQGVAQRTLLPSGTYRLDAFVRTQGISTDEGVGLRVFNVETEKLTGTNDWKRLEAITTIRSNITPVEVQIIRHASQYFDGDITGTAWVDGVSLTRIN